MTIKITILATDYILLELFKSEWILTVTILIVSWKKKVIPVLLFLCAVIIITAVWTAISFQF